MPNKNIHVKGMHCPSCEVLIESEVGEIKGIKSVKANRKSESIDVEFRKNVKDEEKKNLISKIKQKIEKFDEYKVIDGKDVKNAKNNQEAQRSVLEEWSLAIIIFIALALTFYVFQKSGVLDRFSTGDSVNYVSSFGIGIIASLSSCLAVVGAVVVSFSSKQKNKGSRAMAWTQAQFHIGRLIVFFLLGGVLGLIGGSFTISTNFTIILSIVIALVMFYLGLNILGFVPSLADIGIRFPKWMSSPVKNKSAFQDKRLGAFILGGATFFLPCGFTQSMQLFALSSGDFLQGALNLFLFALGTLPVLFFAGYFTQVLTSQKSKLFMKVAGLMVFAFGFYILSNALTLAGFDMNFGTDDVSGSKIVIQDGKQVVEMSVLYSGFEPSVLPIKKNIPVKWVIRGEEVTGCTNEIIVPDLDIRQDIQSGENIVEFTPKESGTISFSCWMGMVKGKFVVVDNDSDLKEVEILEEKPTKTTTQNPSCGCGKTTCDGGCSGGCGR